MPFRLRRLGCIAVAVALIGLSICAEFAAAEPAVDLRRLVLQLGSLDFREREAAAKDLEDMGEPALNALREARRSDDPEIRRRAGFLIAAIEARLCGEVLRFEGHSDGVRCVAFSPDGRWALSGSGEEPNSDKAGSGTLLFWDVTTAKQSARRLKGHRLPVLAVAFSPNGRCAASASREEVILWDLDTGEGKQCPGNGAFALAFFPDGRHILAGNRMLGAERGAEVRSFGPKDVGSVTISSDGRRVLVAPRAWNRFPTCGMIGKGDIERIEQGIRRSSVVRMYDVETGKELRRLEGHAWAISQMTFSSDGRRAITVSGDGTARVWDPRDGSEQRRVDLSSGDKSIRKGPAAFSAAGRRVLEGLEDGSLSLWDVDGGKVLRRFYCHDGPVSCVAISPDGAFALSGGADKTVRLWRLPR